MLFKRKLALDGMFIPKILYSVDDMVNQWLLQFCREESVHNTNLELGSFTSVISRIQLNDFVCNLSVNKCSIVQDSGSPKKREYDHDSGTRGKKTKKEAVMVRNDNVEETWKL